MIQKNLFRKWQSIRTFWELFGGRMSLRLFGALPPLLQTCTNAVYESSPGHNQSEHFQLPSF